MKRYDHLITIGAVSAAIFLLGTLTGYALNTASVNLAWDARDIAAQQLLSCREDARQVELDKVRRFGERYLVIDGNLFADAILNQTQEFNNAWDRLDRK